jgi:hypothetical protein
MMLEAVWFKDGKEVQWISPVENIVCDENMKDISEIEVHNGYNWYSSEDIENGADDFIIRIKKG